MFSTRDFERNVKRSLKENIEPNTLLLLREKLNLDISSLYYGRMVSLLDNIREISGAMPRKHPLKHRVPNSKKAQMQQTHAETHERNDE